MASGEVTLKVSSNAIPFSINDPWATYQSDMIAGRIKITPGSAPYESLQQQQIYQQMGNLQGFGTPVMNPSVNTTPNITPFPLGCPTGFYQAGNTCIPNVDMIPHGPNTIAGAAFPKAVIQDMKPPPTTGLNQNFFVQVLFQNAGGTEGKFYLRVMIPSLNIDQQSPGVNIPAFSNGSLWIQILMPVNAPLLQPIPAIAQVSHLDQAISSPTNGQQIVDDSDNFTIPGPPAPGATATQTGMTCFDMGGKNYCQSASNTNAQCVNINGQWYCPTN